MFFCRNPGYSWHNLYTVLSPCHNHSNFGQVFFCKKRDKNPIPPYHLSPPPPFYLLNPVPPPPWSTHARPNLGISRLSVCTHTHFFYVCARNAIFARLTELTKKGGVGALFLDKGACARAETIRPNSDWACNWNTPKISIYTKNSITINKTKTWNFE